MMNLQEYTAHKQELAANTDARVLRAIAMQEEIANAEKFLEERKKELSTLLADIGSYNDGEWAVEIDLREERTAPNMASLKRVLPEVFEHAEPDAKFILEQLYTFFGRSEAQRIARSVNESAYDNARKLTLGKFDSLTGDSAKKKKYRDIIYGVKLVQRGEAKVTRVAKPLMMQAPSRYPVLEDDFEEEEE